MAIKIYEQWETVRYVPAMCGQNSVTWGWGGGSALGKIVIEDGKIIAPSLLSWWGVWEIFLNQFMIICISDWSFFFFFKCSVEQTLRLCHIMISKPIPQGDVLAPWPLAPLWRLPAFSSTTVRKLQPCRELLLLLHEHPSCSWNWWRERDLGWRFDAGLSGPQ